ncbi:MAG TPA: hypothetical protein VF715_07030 [Thermoleophilaceae bacterium]|jgi:hypothetical protein
MADSKSASFKRLDEFKLPLTDEQKSLIEERVGESVTELTVSAHELDEADANLKVLEVNNVVFSRAGRAAAVVVAN